MFCESFAKRLGQVQPHIHHKDNASFDSKPVNPAWLASLQASAHMHCIPAWLIGSRLSLCKYSLALNETYHEMSSMLCLRRHS